jgi:HK97 family phage portal protein
VKNTKARTALRKQYQQLSGRAADKRWGVARLEREMKALSPVDSRGGWHPLIREITPGAWQANVTVTVEDALQYWAVFRCISIIAGDIAKMRVKLVEQRDDGIWVETNSAAFSPVLRKPNAMQTRIQFFSNWMESKLTRGNTYVLKVRDNRGVVTQLRILDPNRVKPLVSDSGDVFYELQRDNVSGLQEASIVVPASEIIHDRWNTLYHPLVGLSPIYAAGLNALAGLKVEQNSARLFANGAQPSGILTAPGRISDETAQRLKSYFEDTFTGSGAGGTAVVGDGLEYRQLTMSAVDAQVIETLKWSDNTIAAVFGVPAYMINAAAAPATINVEAVTQQYFQQCLQVHIEGIEVLLDEGLGLTEVPGRTLGTEFDLDGLLRMDTQTKVRTLVEGLKGVYSPNEARKMLDLPPTPGGDAVYLQQQNYSLEALNKRDQQDNPFASSAPPAPASEPEDDEEDDTPPEAANDNMAQEAEKALEAIMKGLAA